MSLVEREIREAEEQGRPIRLTRYDYVVEQTEENINHRGSKVKRVFRFTVFDLYTGRVHQTSTRYNSESFCKGLGHKLCTDLNKQNLKELRIQLGTLLVQKQLF